MNYKGHLITNATALVPVAFIAGKEQYSVEAVGAFVAGYIISTLWLSPDLDTHSQPYKNWLFLKFLWSPYKNLIPHRSIVSHGPIVGAVGRLLYLQTILIIASYILIFVLNGLGLGHHTLSYLEAYNRLVELYMNLWNEHRELVIASLCGLTMADTAHLIADVSSSFLRKFRYEPKRRREAQTLVGIPSTSSNNPIQIII